MTEPESLTERLREDGASLKKELGSWFAPTKVDTATSTPEVGSKAPNTAKVPIPFKSGRPTVITFLRHCGCPFAEKTFTSLRTLSSKHPEIAFVAVSHSDQPSTDKWIISVGGAWDVDVIVDDQREAYAAWGLGVASAWHVLNPWSMYNVYALGKSEGIWNKPTESGSRWQMSGSFAVDVDGVVRWAKVPKAADEIPDFKEALAAIGARGHATKL